jgi:hypothetical protein
VSQYRACSKANEGSPPKPSSPRSTGSNTTLAVAAAPRSTDPSPATRVSKSWRTTPNANSRSSSPPRATSTRRSASAASRRASASSRVLPIPADPSTSTTRARPSTASPIAARSAASSRSRSSSSPGAGDPANAPVVAVTKGSCQSLSGPRNSSPPGARRPALASSLCAGDGRPGGAVNGRRPSPRLPPIVHSTASWAAAETLPLGLESEYPSRPAASSSQRRPSRARTAPPGRMPWPGPSGRSA